MRRTSMQFGGVLATALFCGSWATATSRAGAGVNLHSLFGRNPDEMVYTTDGTCGIENSGRGLGMHCSTESNKCCSFLGYCGDGDAHCVERCQPEFGECKAESESGLPSASSIFQCGPLFNNDVCTNNACCSSSGYCGSSTDYCRSPDCLLDFGRCDATTTPEGADTSSVQRPHVGNLTYTEIVFHCTKPGTVALSFDDGPYEYTDKLLDILEKHDVKATFFVSGNNIGKGPIDEPQYGWDTVIKRIVSSGHQLASHTWSHADLSKLTSEARKAEIIKNEMALRNILGDGYIPTYLRPPYSSCDAACRSDTSALGYHLINFDLDSGDTNMTSIAKKMVPSEQSFLEALSSADPKNDSFIVIAHDIKQLTVSILAEYMLQTVKEKGFRAVTVGECLGDPSENWYRPGGGNAIVKATVNATTGTVTGENKSPATLLKAGLAVPVLAAVILGFLVAS